jgi:ankyrin repeat protein
LSGKAETIEILLDAGSNIEAESPKKHTSLHLACYAAIPTDYHCAKILIERGARMGAKTSYNSGSDKYLSDGETALQLAVWKDSSQVVKLLVDKGADIYARNRGGHTALDIAVILGRTQAITILPVASGRTTTTAERVRKLFGELFS